MDKSLITYSLFEAHPGINAFTTSRDTIRDISHPRYTLQNHKDAVLARKALAGILQIDSRNMIFPKQEHTSIVTEVPVSEFSTDKAADALITNHPGICLCIQTADCVPVLFYDPVKKVIAAAHAGWRGTTGLIAGEVLELFYTRYHSAPEDILVAMGPAISGRVYEVGDEVAGAVKDSIPFAERAIVKKGGGKFHVDLHVANKLIMTNRGIPPENIEASGYCTFTHSHLFFSARREGIETGRMVTGIMLNR